MPCVRDDGRVRYWEQYEHLALRIAADLRTRFSTADVHFRPVEPYGWVIEVFDGELAWGTIGTQFDLDDDGDLSPQQVQRELVHQCADVFDNLWPDALTDPWPPCPEDPGHPLQPRLVRGVACWTCLEDLSVTVPLRSLPSLGG